MSYFGKNATVQKMVVVQYFGKKYVTASGLAKMLAQDVMYRIMERFEKANKARYGVPYYSDKAGVKKWKENQKRLRAKAYRRLLPHVEKIFK